MSGITLSKKYGVNPSVEVCHICGKDMGVILFGASYKDRNGKPAEAPHKICSGHICDDCKKIIDDGGIFFIEVQDGESGSNPFRTGRIMAVKEEVVAEMFKEYGKVNFMEHSLWEQVFIGINCGE